MKIKIKDSVLKSILQNPKLNGSGSHYISDCPYCGKKEHFYIQRETERKTKFGKNASYYWQCKRCGENGGIVKLLRKLQRLDILRFGTSIDVDEFVLENKLKKKDIEELDLTIPKITLPIGFKRIFNSEYLNNRGFTKQQYDFYYVGKTELLKKLKDYLIFPIFDNNVIKGYIARSILSKEEIEHKKREGIKILRYNNSVTDFAKLIYGIDEIIVGVTHTVIAVEGIFDKFNIDRLLNLFDEDEIKCNATFGNKISEYQIVKWQRKGIENIILLYDPDAINQSKKYSIKLSDYFNVYVGFLKDMDPGDIQMEELMEVLDNLQSPLDFHIDKILKRVL